MFPVRLFSTSIVALLLGSAMFGCAGCRSTPTTVSSGLPARHVVRDDGFVVRANLELTEEHALLRELRQTRRTIVQALHLPPQHRPVQVYIFSSDDEYGRYMAGAYPGLPVRRAYFIGTQRELAVYTFWSDRLPEDLRHEFTHGLLHASLGEVPLWIDEGLAEYFEVPGAVGTANGQYVRNLTDATANGWRPDVSRLERLEQVHQMQRIDYQEAWAWTHYLLHGPPHMKPILLEYLADVRTKSDPVPLSERIRAAEPAAETGMLNHLAGLSTGATWAGATATHRQ